MTTKEKKWNTWTTPLSPKFNLRTTLEVTMHLCLPMQVILLQLKAAIVGIYSTDQTWMYPQQLQWKTKWFLVSAQIKCRLYVHMIWVTAELRLCIEQAAEFTYTTPSTHRKKSQEPLEETIDSKFGTGNVYNKQHLILPQCK